MACPVPQELMPCTIDPLAALSYRGDDDVTTTTSPCHPEPPPADNASDDGEESTTHHSHSPLQPLSTCDRPPPTSALAASLATLSAIPVPSNAPTEAIAAALINAHALHDTFYIVDLGAVHRLHTTWTTHLPRVRPMYAVKCNPDRGLVAFLAALGAGFDCATLAEVQQTLPLVAHPRDDLIYAHPCKPPAQLQAAAAAGVSMVTFDTPCELHKLAALHSSCEAVLRIRADDPSARCCLGNKFGAEAVDVPMLLETARALGIQVVGVSFHVGSGATNPAAFSEAIAAARGVFDLATAMGFSMRLLDLGGGFSKGLTDAFVAVARAINTALDAHFPAGCGVRIIAEPGRFYAEGAATLAVVVNGVRSQYRTAPGAAQRTRHIDYYVSDGVYGSFNCLLYDHPELEPHVLHMVSNAKDASMQAAPGTVFGPTCDGADKVLEEVVLPAMQPGDWLLFPNMGAYTIAGACNFNGFDAVGARRFYLSTA